MRKLRDSENRKPKRHTALTSTSSGIYEKLSGTSAEPLRLYNSTSSIFSPVSIENPLFRRSRIVFAASGDRAGHVKAIM